MTRSDNNVAPGDVVAGSEPSKLVEIQRAAPFGGKTLVEGVGLMKLVKALVGERQTLRTEGKRDAYRDSQQQLRFGSGGNP